MNLIINYPNNISCKNIQTVIDYLNNLQNNYSKLTHNIYNDIYKLCSDIKLSNQIIDSIRESLVRGKMLNCDINSKINEINQKYNSSIPILKLSTDYDISPLNILNKIFKIKYQQPITYFINNQELLSSDDLIQFKSALNNDIYTLIDDNKINEKYIKYVQFVKQYLNKNNTKYISDKILLVKCLINSKPINWIYCCNEYGYDNEYLLNKLNNICKENNNHGYGCIFFSLGFCLELKIDNALLIYFPFKNEINKINKVQTTNFITTKNGDWAKYGYRYKTDKVTHHYYYQIYPLYLEHYRRNNGSMLEIGTNQSRSMKMWLDYFSKAFIYGIDIGVSEKGNRFQIFKCDQSNTTELENVKINIINNKLPVFFIIDDGSHLPDHQLLTFNYFFDTLLIPGGCYIIEDIETSYWTKNNIYGYPTHYGYKHEKSIVEIFKNIIDDINGEFLTEKNKTKHEEIIGKYIPLEIRKLILSISFAQNCIIIMKKTNDENIPQRSYRFKENL